MSQTPPIVFTYTHLSPVCGAEEKFQIGASGSAENPSLSLLTFDGWIDCPFELAARIHADADLSAWVSSAMRDAEQKIDEHTLEI